MRKTAILVIVVFMLASAVYSQTEKPKPDYLFWGLAGANLIGALADCGYSLHYYRLGKVGECNPIGQYLFDNSPQAAPIYALASTAAIITTCYFINKLGCKPLGHVLLGGIVLARGYYVYLTISIASKY